MYYVYYPIHIYDYRYIFKHWRLFKLWFINNVVFLVSYRYRVFVCISVHLSCKLPRGRYGKRFVSGLLAPSFLLLQRYFQAKMSDLFVLDIGNPPKYCPQCEESGLITKVKKFRLKADNILVLMCKNDQVTSDVCSSLKFQCFGSGLGCGSASAYIFPPGSGSAKYMDPDPQNIWIRIHEGKIEE